MMKFKLFDIKVTDEREKALNNKVAAECYCIMIACTLVYIVYGSLFNNGVISADYLTLSIVDMYVFGPFIELNVLAVNTFGSSGITVLGCLLATGLITLIIMID